MDARSRLLLYVRWFAAIAALAVGLFSSGFTAALAGMYLYEHESGLHHLAQGYTLWGLLLSALMGMAGIAGCRVLLRRRAASWWLLVALAIPAVFALLLAFTPAE